MWTGEQRIDECVGLVAGERARAYYVVGAQVIDAEITLIFFLI